MTLQGYWPRWVAGVGLAMICVGLAPVQAKSFTGFQFPTATAFPTPDTLTYQIVIKDPQSGGTVKDEAGTLREGEGTLKSRLITSGPYDKLEITYAGTEPGGQELGWVSYLDAKTGKPWGFTRRYSDERGTETLDLTFADGKINSQRAQINGETIQRQLTNVGQFTLMPLLFLAGRSLEFEEGNLFTSMLLDPDHLTFQTPIISIVGREVIPVPAGIYECWKVEFKLGAEREYGYYAVKNPRIVAQYETATRLLRLKKHAIADPNAKPKPKAKAPAKPKPAEDPMGPPLPPKKS